MNGDTMFDASFSDAYAIPRGPNNPLLIVKSQNDNTRYQSYILEPKSKYLSQTVKGELYQWVHSS